MSKRTVSGITLTLLLIGMLALAFNIQPVEASGAIYIRADGSVDPPDVPILTVDNVTYTLTGSISESIVVERDDIVVDGRGFTVQGLDEWSGIKLDGRSNVTIKNIEIKDSFAGISLYESSHNYIYRNNVTSNLFGIELIGADHNIVFGNDVSANRLTGIVLADSSHNCIFGNTITNNLRFAMEASSRLEVWNIIYHNNFINNSIAPITNIEYVWDDGYPSGGNYWSDYNGTDLYSGLYQNETGCDGIGDTPYVIESRYRDNYPLMNPWEIISGNLQILKPANGAVIVGPVNITFTVENTGRNIEFAKRDSANSIDLEIEYALNQTHGWGIKLWSTSDHGLNLSSGAEYTQTIVYDPPEYEEAVPPVFINDAPYGEATIRLVHWKQMEGSYSYGEFGITEIDVTLQRNNTAPPTVTLLSPENKTYTTTSIPLTFTPNETTSWIGYSLNNQSNVTIAGNTTLTGLSEGTHSIIVYANDTAGNMGASQTVYFTVSLPYGPTADFTTAPEIADVDETVKLDAAASLSGWNGTHKMPITEYRWDFGDGNETTTSVPIIYHNFGNSGNYCVTLTVYAPGATPDTDSTTKKVTITAIPVGGYSFPIEGYTTSKPLTLCLTLVAIFAAVFTLIKRKTHRSSKQLEQTL